MCRRKWRLNVKANREAAMVILCQAHHGAGATTMGDECSPVGVLLIRTSKRTAATFVVDDIVFTKVSLTET